MEGGEQSKKAKGGCQSGRTKLAVSTSVASSKV